MPDFSPGSEFAGHRIDAEIKRGGMGVVYRATDLRLKRTVALKVIAPELAREADFKARFEREWSVAAAIRHPNVISVYHSDERDGVLYTTMEWIDGLDLGDLIAREGRLSLPLAADITAQVAAGLDAAHVRGLIHRDVKPGNVLLRPDEKGGYHAYLSDFGLTKRVDGRTALTVSGMFVGTVDYVAPEQLLGGAIDARADVYALGCVLFHALAGLPPYRGQSEWATLKAHESGQIPSLCAFRPDLPEQVDELIVRALAKSPAERYPSAGDLGRAAQAAAERRPVAEPERSVAAGEAAPGTAPRQETVARGTAPAVEEETKPPGSAAETKLAAQQETKLAGAGEPTSYPPKRQAPGSGGTFSGLPFRPDWRLAAIAGVAGIGLIAALLAVAGVFGGSDETPTPSPPARRVVLGSATPLSAAACPELPCQAIGSVTGFQVNDGFSRAPFKAPIDGKVVAWTLTLAKPAGNQRSFFNEYFGAPPEARLSILRRAPGASPPHYTLRAQGPIEVLSDYLGGKASFDTSLPVQRGDIVALTVPTWAPAFARGRPSSNTWRGSRENCAGDAVRQGRPQMTVGAAATYACLYSTSRILYTATVVEGG